MAWRQWRKTASEPAVQMVGFALLVICAVWAVLGYSLWVLRGQIQETARNDVAALTQSLEAHLSATLENARLVLGRTVDVAALHGLAENPDDPLFLERLPRAIDHVSQVSGLGVFAADGIIRHAVVRDEIGEFMAVGHDMDVNDRDYVTSMDTHPSDTLFVGTPVRSLAGGQWVLPVSRPIRDSVGALAGGAVALIDMETLLTLFDAVRPGENGTIALVRRDGVLLARTPFNEADIGTDLNILPDMSRLLLVPSLLNEITMGADGQEDIQVVVPAPRFPLTIIARVPLDQVLADWRAALWRSLAIGFTVAIVIGAMALVVASQWHRRQRVDVALASSRRALSASLQRFERAIAGSTAAMWEFDLRTREGYLAPQWEDILGWRDVRDPYRTWRDNLHPEDRERVLGAMRAHLETHAAFDTEYRLRAADDTWRWVKARGQASWDSQGQPTVMSGTVHDITDLRHGEERLRLAMEATHDGLWDLNVSSGDLFLSLRWKTMLGYAADAPLSPRFRTFLRLVHPEDRAGVLAWMRGFLLNDGMDAGEHEYRMRRADGTWAWVRGAAKVTERDASGWPLRVVGTHQDVSRRREELLQLREARRLAEEGNRAKSEFLATMSHELRTPLNAISGFSESLECQFFGALNAKQLEYIGDIRSSAEHLTSLISDILDMAKIEAGHSQLSEEPVDVAAAIRAKVQMLRQRAAQKDIDLIEDLEPLPPYNLDPRRFGQMVLNLLSNAVKFTQAGGAVTVRALSAPNGSLSIAVVDTGIGIAAEDLERVLEPFTQVDSRLSRQYEGTGLGLPLVKAMAEMHGGSLCLSSALGRGTTAVIEFPASRRLTPAARVVASAE